MTVLTSLRPGDTIRGNEAAAIGAGVPWLAERRDRALETLRVRGVPHRRIEDWKYSDLKSLLEKDTGDVALPLRWKLSPLPAGIEQFDLARVAAAPEWVKSHFGRS